MGPRSTRRWRPEDSAEQGEDSLSSRQPVGDRCRVLSTVENRNDGCDIAPHFVIDSKREAPGKRSMQVAIGFGMTAAKQHQCIDLCVMAVEKVVSDARLLSLVERKSFQ